MKYYFDTEFIEDGKTIDLISIGIVAADGREYYAINEDCDFSKAHPWVKENVITQLPEKYPQPPREYGSLDKWEKSKLWKPKSQIKEDVALFLGCRHSFYIPNPKNWIEKQYWKLPFVNIETKVEYILEKDTPKPELWADYSSYDWVVFCQLFGTMMDLPKGFPMYCNDIQQFASSLGNPEIPKDRIEHNALDDARWVRKAYLWLRDYQINGVR